MMNHTYGPSDRTKRSATALALIAAYAVAIAIPAQATELKPSPQATEQAAPAAAGQTGSAPEATTAAPPSPTTPGPADTADTAAPDGQAAVAALVGLPVLSSDGKTVGAIEKIVTTDDGKVREMIVETGGFFGIGARRIAVPVEQVTTGGNSVRLAMTAADFGKLPDVASSGQG